MNILFIANHLNTGGITSYLLTLAAGLKERGHNVYIASSGGSKLNYFSERGINFIPIPIRTKNELSPKIIYSAFKLRGIIKDNNIGVIHSHSRTTQVLASLLSKLTGARHIFTCHGYFKRRLLRRIFPCWGDKIIAISQQVKEHLINDFKAGESDIIVVHNGIDIRRFVGQGAGRKAEKKKELGLGPGPVVGIVARLSDVKGHSYLIKAFKEVAEKFSDAQLLIAGEGNMKEELLSLARRLRIEGKVYFIPEVEDTRCVLAAIDVFVMPSLKEGLGLALMEAEAMGLAVVGSDIGGIKTLIEHGKSGLLVSPADPGGLALAITELLQNPKQAEQFGKEAAAFIKENFSDAKMVSETEKVYLNA